jgi:peptidoglycan hydrolase-like protein with peptidoglycan-binding domain
MKRAEVGDLQQALSFLGLTIASEEKNNQRFGATTRAAVRQFQIGHKLPETGEVDEATALAINKELADRGALDVEPRSDSDLPDPNPPINYKRRRSVTVTRPSHFHALWMLPEAEAIAITRPAIC